MTSLVDSLPAEKPATKKSFSVFIVDDDQAYLAALGFRLVKENKNNTKVFCYSSGEECLRNMQLNPSVIILDYYLDTSNPKAMSGLETLRKIKEINPGVPVVMLSGQGDIDVALDIYEAGAYSYIMKNKRALDAIDKIIERLAKSE